MSVVEQDTENLFTYGTLQREEVQFANFGRRLKGKPDVLSGYRLMMTQVRDQNFVAANGATQRTVQFTGDVSDFVAGVVFAVTRDELERADAYEPTDYLRIIVKLKSGLDAWVYLQASQP